MFHIRRAVPEDALAINIVNVYTWKTTYSGLMPDSVIDARIQNLRAGAEKCGRDIVENGCVLVAEADHAIVGFCRYGKSRNLDYLSSGEIYALYVLAGYQGLGIGKGLFETVAGMLAAQGHSGMLINCLRGNPTIGFYQHMGGKIVGQRQDAVQGGVICEDVVYYEELPC